MTTRTCNPTRPSWLRALPFFAPLLSCAPALDATRAPDWATGSPVDWQTSFLSASSTKLLTAAAILRLVDQGRVALDDSLSRHVPWQPYPSSVTIRRLLNHSAGVPNPLPLTWLHPAQNHETVDERGAIKAVLSEHRELDFEPGTDYG